jgi:exopolysaccharide biosynthesis polyprenyl glycosylphosphotransferase
MKSKLRKIEASLVFLLKLMLYLSLFWTFYGMYSRYNFQLRHPLKSPSRTSVIVIVTYVIVSYMLANIYGRYDIGKRKSKPIIYSLFLASLFTDIISVFVLSIMNTNAGNNRTFEVERPLLLIPVIIIQFVIIWIFVYLGNYLYFKIFDPERCVIVTSSERSLNEILRGVRKYKLQYNVERVADYRDSRLKKFIMEADTVILYEVPVNERTEIIEYCYQNMKNVLFNPGMHDIIETNTKQIIVDDISMLGSFSKGFTLEQRVLKRAMDVVLSLIVIVVTSPLMLIAAIAIKAEDGGKVIFKQNRATRYGKIFQIYKLRTMKEDAGTYALMENDSRVTKVGAVLRKYRIDELPQFINVLRGEMSVVGPRPEMLANIFNYTNEMPEFEYRLRVKAGITGHAQIAGRYNTTPKDKLILDLTYIEEYSLWLDIKLLFQTLIVLFKKDSTAAFTQDKEYVTAEQYEMLLREEDVEFDFIRKKNKGSK